VAHVAIEVVAGTVILFTLATAALVVAGLLFVRRRYRLAVRRYRELGHAGVAAEAFRMAEVQWRRHPVHDPAWRRSQRARRRMHRAVEAASQAVRHADAAGAPVGDLPSVCRRLQSSAGQVDHLLRVPPLPADPAALPADPVGEADAVAVAAGRIHAAARASLHQFASPAVTSASDAAHLEVVAVHEGLRATSLPR